MKTPKKGVVEYAILWARVITRIALGWSKEDKIEDEGFFLYALADALLYPAYIEQEMRSAVTTLYNMDYAHALPSCRHLDFERCSDRGLIVGWVFVECQNTDIYWYPQCEV